MVWDSITTVCETPLRTDFQGALNIPFVSDEKKKSTFWPVFKVRFFRILKEIKPFSWVSETSWAPGNVLLPREESALFWKKQTKPKPKPDRLWSPDLPL